MAAVDAGPTVDNPLRRQLVALQRDLHREMHELQGLLRKSCADVGRGATWVGPAAATWHTEAEGRRRDILAQLAKLIPLVDAEIAGSPEKVTPAQAKALLADAARP